MAETASWRGNFKTVLPLDLFLCLFWLIKRLLVVRIALVLWKGN